MNGTGNALSNVLQGNGANNTLSGGEGDDTLYGYGGDDTLHGHEGADTLIGGAGNDAYAVYDTADVVVENANEGTDSVWVWIWSSGSYTLSASVENLTLGSPNAFTGIGNELNNLIGVYDGSAANVLNGAGGDDTLNGGAGSDTLTGGAGADRFDFNLISDGNDTITDFTRGSGGDVLDIQDVLLGYTPGTSNAASFVQLFASGSSTTLRVNADGAGSDFVDLALLQGNTGLLLNEMIAQGNLVM